MGTRRSRGMTRNIDQWYSLQGIFPVRRETVQKFLDGLHFEYLCQTAKAIRQRGPSGNGPGSGVKVLTDHFTAVANTSFSNSNFRTGHSGSRESLYHPFRLVLMTALFSRAPAPKSCSAKSSRCAMWPRKPPFRFLVYTVMNFKALTPSGPHTHLWTELWESLYGRYHQLLWTTSPTFTAKWQRSS